MGRYNEDILKFAGLYVYKTADKFVIETFVSRKSSNGQFLWEPLPPNQDVGENIDTGSWADFFIGNPKDLPITRNQCWHSIVVNGFYVLKMTNGWSIAINVRHNTWKHDQWFNLSLFDTDLNNHICEFILHL